VPGPAPPPPGFPPLARGDRPLPRLPGYEVLELLGTRGRASVYKARQTGLRRVVALGLLRDFAGGADAKNGFRHEAQTLARLGHPHLLQTFDVGECESGLYYAMEYCPGGSLARKLEREALPPEEAAGLVEKVARAVQAAHERGIVHGRLAAAEVLLTADGSPKLGGFGQACLFGEEPAGLGEDIRDLGRLLLRCCKEAPTPAVADLCRKCESGAYGSARDLADDLLWLLAGEAAPPASGDRFARLRRDAGRLRLGLLGSFATLLVILVGVAGLYRRAGRASLPIDLARAGVWVSADGGGLHGGPRLTAADLDWLRGRWPELRVEGCLCGRAGWKADGGVVPCLVLSEDALGHALGPAGMLPPSLREQMRPDGSVVVCEGDLARLGVTGSAKGKRAVVGAQAVEITAAAGHRWSPLGPLVFCNARTGRLILGAGRDEFTFLLVECDEPGRANGVVSAIRGEHDDLRAWRRDELSRAVRLRWLARDPVALAWAAMSLAAVTATAAVLGRALRMRARWARWLLVLAVPLLAAGIAVVAARGLIWWAWPSVAEVLHTPLLDATALVAAALLAGLTGAFAWRAGRGASAERTG
jgi:hypothetical protein